MHDAKVDSFGGKGSEEPFVSPSLEGLIPAPAAARADDAEEEEDEEDHGGVRVQYEGLSYSVTRDISRIRVVTVGDQWLKLLGCCSRRPKRTTLDVLKDLNGVLRPCRLTLLLGPPGELDEERNALRL